MWELLSSLSSLAHVSGIVHAVFRGFLIPQVRLPGCSRPARQEAPVLESAGEQQICSVSWVKTHSGYKQGV